MSTFVQGEQREKTFYVKNKGTDEIIAISDLTASLYEVKTNREIQRFDSDGTNPAPIDLSGGYFKFVFTPDITRKCPVGVEVWLDIYVGSLERIFRGRFGTATKSPLSSVPQTDPIS